MLRLYTSRMIPTYSPIIKVVCVNIMAMRILLGLNDYEMSSIRTKTRACRHPRTRAYRDRRDGLPRESLPPPQRFL